MSEKCYETNRESGSWMVVGCRVILTCADLLAFKCTWVGGIIIAFWATWQAPPQPIGETTGGYIHMFLAVVMNVVGEWNGFLSNLLISSSHFSSIRTSIIFVWLNFGYFLSFKLSVINNNTLMIASYVENINFRMDSETWQFSKRLFPWFQNR